MDPVCSSCLFSVTSEMSRFLPGNASVSTLGKHWIKPSEPDFCPAVPFIAFFMFVHTLLWPQICEFHSSCGFPSDLNEEAPFIVSKGSPVMEIAFLTVLNLLTI